MPSKDHFIRLKAASRTAGLMHAGQVRPIFSRLERSKPRRDFQFPPHQHREFEIIFIIRGPYFCQLNGERFRLAKDTVLVVEPGDWHEDLCRPPLDYAAFICTLHSRADGKHLRNLRFFKKETPMARRHTNFRAAVFLPLLYKIAAESKTNDAIGANLQDLLAEELFWRAVRAFDVKWLAPWLVSSRGRDRFLTRFFDAMAARAHRSLSVAELARALGVSQRTLHLRCVKLLGDSPARLFLRFKIEQARKLFVENEISVKEASQRFGFSNPYHFSKAYKTITGFAPSRTVD
ncbi:MAG: AraC family transcriptional regulator [Verrucomicrobiales bacterium]|jgi:AraC-like DNA-binding protein|nr:AraC family transcriptional regulator [Verrucomicrobiales bacterium]